MIMKFIGFRYHHEEVRTHLDEVNSCLDSLMEPGFRFKQQDEILTRLDRARMSLLPHHVEVKKDRVNPKSVLTGNFDSCRSMFKDSCVQLKEEYWYGSLANDVYALFSAKAEGLSASRVVGIAMTAVDRLVDRGVEEAFGVSAAELSVAQVRYARFVLNELQTEQFNRLRYKGIGTEVSDVMDKCSAIKMPLVALYEQYVMHKGQIAEKASGVKFHRSFTPDLLAQRTSHNIRDMHGYQDYIGNVADTLSTPKEMLGELGAGLQLRTQVERRMLQRYRGHRFDRHIG